MDSRRGRIHQAAPEDIRVRGVTGPAIHRMGISLDDLGGQDQAAARATAWPAEAFRQFHRGSNWDQSTDRQAGLSATSGGRNDREGRPGVWDKCGNYDSQL